MTVKADGTYIYLSALKGNSSQSQTAGVAALKNTATGKPRVVRDGPCGKLEGGRGFYNPFVIGVPF
jgi:hypothetical protein